MKATDMHKNNSCSRNMCGRKIRELRARNELTQKELESILQKEGIFITSNYLSRIERGIRTVTDIELMIFCKVLCVSPAELVQSCKDSQSSSMPGVYRK